MPMLADLDEPPRRRASHLVVGILLAAGVAAIVVGWLFPWLIATVLGGAQDFDRRAREQEAYMQQLCTTAFDPERDEDLCSCVLAVEFPALDCQPPWRRWALARQAQRCTDDDIAGRYGDYCECILEVAAAVNAADEIDKNAAAHGFDRCDTRSEAMPLPQLEEG